MTARLLAPAQPPQGLQPLDITRHLGGVADLIAICFSPEVEEGWHGAIRELHFLGRLGPLVRLLTWLDPHRRIFSQGYVWLADGRLVGNVSAQPSEARASTWIVANVAVHPDFRRRGIAQQMMQATLEHIRQRGGTEAILQVDEDNVGAIELYRRLGFAHLTTRHSWLRSGRRPIPAHEPAPFEIRLRAANEWRHEFNLAELARPHGLAWNRPLHPADFRRSFGRRVEQFLNGESEEHWVAVTEYDQIVGSLILQAGLTEGDRLTLLTHPAYHGQVERPLLIRGLRRLGLRPWPLRMEHPADDLTTSELLRAFGFTVARTLRWMRKDVR